MTLTVGFLSINRHNWGSLLQPICTKLTNKTYGLKKGSSSKHSQTRRQTATIWRHGFLSTFMLQKRIQGGGHLFFITTRCHCACFKLACCFSTALNAFAKWSLNGRLCWSTCLIKMKDAKALDIPRVQATGGSGEGHPGACDTKKLKTRFLWHFGLTFWPNASHEVLCFLGIFFFTFFH